MLEKQWENGNHYERDVSELYFDLHSNLERMVWEPGNLYEDEVHKSQ